jgi:hypothetical protein
VAELPISAGGERTVDTTAGGHLLAQAFTDGGRQRVDLIAWQDGSFTVTLTDLASATRLASTLITADDASGATVSESPDALLPTIWPARDAEDGARKMMELTRRRPMPHA